VPTNGEKILQRNLQIIAAHREGVVRPLGEGMKNMVDPAMNSLQLVSSIVFGLLG
jgi:hypothetical protein